MQVNFYQKALILSMVLLLAAMTALADKPTPRIQQIPDFRPERISPFEIPPVFRTGDTCTVNLAGEPIYYIYPWVVGDELYKAYQDPSVTCEGPYPFTVEYIYIPLIYYAIPILFSTRDGARNCHRL